MQAELTDTLSALGLTSLEARTYACLVRGGPATGYRTAQTLGCAPANVYAALAALQTKGAVLLDNGDGKFARAVPPAEFLGRLEREFRERRENAVRLLQDAPPESGDHRAYRLEQVDLVLERARAMLARGTYCALIDGSPLPLEQLRDNLTAAASNYRVVVKAYAPLDVSSANVISGHASECSAIALLGQHLHVVVDMREFMFALFDDEMTIVRQGVWSGCPFLTSAHHIGLMFEFMFTRLWTDPDEQLSAAAHRLARRDFDYLSMRHTPGFAAFARLHEADKRRGKSRGRVIGEGSVSGARRRTRRGSGRAPGRGN